MKTIEKLDYIRYHVKHLNEKYNLNLDFHKEYNKRSLFRNNKKLLLWNLNEIIAYIDWLYDWIEIWNNEIMNRFIEKIDNKTYLKDIYKTIAIYDHDNDILMLWKYAWDNLSLLYLFIRKIAWYNWIAINQNILDKAIIDWYLNDHLKVNFNPNLK